MFLILYFFVVVFFFFLLRNVGYGIGNHKEHPALFTLLVKYFVFVLPAMVVTNMDVPLLLNSSRYGVSSESLYLGNMFLILNLFILLFVIFVFKVVGGRLYLNYYIEPAVHNRFKVYYFTLGLLFLQIFWISYSVFSGDALPLLNILQGDFVQANINKKAIIEGELGSKMPVISYIPKYFFVFVPIFLHYSYVVFGGVKRKTLFVLSLLFSFFYFLASGHKAPLFFFLIYFFFYRRAILPESAGILKTLLFFMVLAISVVLVYLLSFGYLNESSLEYGVNSLLERVFVGQSQGLYYIIEFIEPNLKYLSSWVPFSSLMFDSVSRADIDVVALVFPDSKSYSNRNTVFIGEAYSVFGSFGVFFSSIYVWVFYFSIAYLFRSLSKKKPLFFVPVCYSVFYNIPITQGASFFFIPKELIVVVFFYLVLYFFYLMCFVRSKI